MSGSYWERWRKSLARRYYAIEQSYWYRSPPFKLYGLPTGWQGHRSVDGPGLTWSVEAWYRTIFVRRRIVTRLGLIHRSSDGGVLAVSSYRAATSIRVIESAVAGDLERSDGTDRPPETGGAGLSSRLGPDRPEWQELEILVDGLPRRFRLLEKRNSWSAVAQVEQVYVKVFSSGFNPDDVSLVNIADLAPYLR